MAKSKGIAGFGIDTRYTYVPRSKSGKKNHYTSPVDVLLVKQVIPRPTRRNYPPYDHPNEALAIYMAVWNVFNKKTHPQRFKIIERIAPWIPEDHLLFTGRKMTSKVMYNRLDKGIRQREMKNYIHLIKGATAFVEKRMTEIGIKNG